MLEIERKFLVKNGFDLKNKSFKQIKQGYLSTNKEATVRIRISDNQAWLTVKSKSSNNGLTRHEWEYVIPIDQATDMLKLCKNCIEKKRYNLIHDHLTFEVDVFEKQNAGLIIAELELNHPDQPFKKPNWLCEEVTGDQKYYHSSLIEKPFNCW